MENQKIQNDMAVIAGGANSAGLSADQMKLLLKELFKPNQDLENFTENAASAMGGVWLGDTQMKEVFASAKGHYGMDNAGLTEFTRFISSEYNFGNMPESDVTAKLEQGFGLYEKKEQENARAVDAIIEGAQEFVNTLFGSNNEQESSPLEQSGFAILPNFGTASMVMMARQNTMIQGVGAQEIAAMQAGQLDQFLAQTPKESEGVRTHRGLKDVRRPNAHENQEILRQDKIMDAEYKGLEKADPEQLAMYALNDQLAADRLDRLNKDGQNQDMAAAAEKFRTRGARTSQIANQLGSKQVTQDQADDGLQRMESINEKDGIKLDDQASDRAFQSEWKRGSNPMARLMHGMQTDLEHGGPEVEAQYLNKHFGGDQKKLDAFKAGLESGSVTPEMRQQMVNMSKAHAKETSMTYDKNIKGTKEQQLSASQDKAHEQLDAAKSQIPHDKNIQGTIPHRKSPDEKDEIAP
ncbi:MAG: hypothetical protein FWE16_06010 [Firmicutes bacterium]|nr:hypothetical protein [Bacillota bacterium]